MHTVSTVFTISIIQIFCFVYLDYHVPVLPLRYKKERLMEIAGTGEHILPSILWIFGTVGEVVKYSPDTTREPFWP